MEWWLLPIRAIVTMYAKQIQEVNPGADPTVLSAPDLKLSSLWLTFRNILIVVSLILLFAVVQMFMLNRVCSSGMKTADSLEHQGLPYLDQFGDMQEHLALFRLYSYEYVFARESEKDRQAKATKMIVEQTRSDLEKINSLLPTGQGRQLTTNLETAFDDLNREFCIVQSLVNSNFPAAMTKLDGDIPPRIAKTTAAEQALEEYGYHLSAQQANATFGSFGWIKNNAAFFGAANIVVALGAVMFVLIALRRTRAQLSVAMGRLNERTEELTASLSLLNATLDSTADGIVAVDQENKVSCYNKNFVKLWGFSEEMLRRKRTAELMTLCSIQTTDPDQFLKQLEKQQVTPAADNLYVIEFKDGRTVECFAKTQWVNGQHSGAVLNFRDITGRKKALAELAYERELLRSLLDTSEETIYFKDKKSRFLRCSAAMARIFNAENPAALVGRSDFDFFTKEHAQPAFEDEQQIIKTGKPIISKVEKETWPDGRVTWTLTSKMPLRSVSGEIIGTFGISKDITAIKEAETKLEAVHRQLLDTSRQAGMAEVATNVLHNVGNVLNSINVSTTLVQEKIKKSKTKNLGRVADLVRENQGNLAAFFTTDDKGKQLPDYLARLSEHLAKEQAEILQEVEQTRKHIEHIKDIVTMQQSYAKVSGIAEKVSVIDLVEDSLRMNAGALARHDVQVTREYPEYAPEINVEKHKVLQILVNLIRNAKYACDESGRSNKQMTIRVRNGGDRVQIDVVDNGVGIPAENMTRIFNHGFTTRQSGHGFGLHSGALAAREMGGTLAVFSEGAGHGARFTLDVPVELKRTHT
jgi:PAS domain S-box-containing protein